MGEGGGAQFKNLGTKIPIFINVDIAKIFNLYPSKIEFLRTHLPYVLPVKFLVQLYS